ncbi:hypothetical protein ACJIZ3_009745 [Penstemon smallii]|uniref:Uncharacterized protein n=1 Tax=Penstemon smallii TaxID=265156 RepID=A0ABD3TDE1_9LAMI
MLSSTHQSHFKVQHTPSIASHFPISFLEIRRKKWSEAEERSLIDKYGEMVCDGILCKMKTREKKYKPIALYVNSIHHIRDPNLYPWQWTWKDVSTKVQNMRHQYALVKQKIRKQESLIGEDEFDWMEGITHWSNFLRYKQVFGDVPIGFSTNDSMVVVERGFEGGGDEMDIGQFGQLGQMGDGDFVGGMDLEFDYDGEEGEENYKSENCSKENEGGTQFVCHEDIEEPNESDMRKKRKTLKGVKKKALSFLANNLENLREVETRFEKIEVERELERQRRENLRLETENKRETKWEEMEKDKEVKYEMREKLRRQWVQEWEDMERDSEERERRRRDEELIHEREWEDRLNKRRLEWKKRMDEMLSQHRVEMGQIQARILNEQQNVTNHFLGIVSQWTGQTTGLSDHNGASNHYLSQMMQNLNGGMVHGDARVVEDNQEDQFIVDG